MRASSARIARRPAFHAGLGRHRAELVGGLPVRQCVAACRGRAGREAAGHGVDPRRRLRVRQRLRRVVGGPVRQAGRHPRHFQLPSGAPRFLRLPCAEPRASGRAQGQLRLHGPDRRPQVGAAEHRRVRRRSEERHHLRRVCRRRLGAYPPDIAAFAGLFQKAISESGGGRDGVLTGRPMRQDGVDRQRSGLGRDHRRELRQASTGSRGRTRPHWPSCAPSSVAEIVDGGQESAGPGGPAIYSGPILDGTAGGGDGPERLRGRASGEGAAHHRVE